MGLRWLNLKRERERDGAAIVIPCLVFHCIKAKAAVPHPAVDSAKTRLPIS